MSRVNKEENCINDSISRSYRVDNINLIREYWRENLHDIEVTNNPIGSKEFFEELEKYHYEKLEYLLNVIDFNAYKEKNLLEIGCGLGIDLVRFAKVGAIVTGIDLADNAIELARRNFELQGVNGELLVMNGEDLSFNDNSFDIVFAHGVLAYTDDAALMVREIYRVLKPGGEAILMMYHRNSWLFFIAELLGFRLGREDAPVFKTYSIDEFQRMLKDFSHSEILTVRFPVKTRIHKGLKATIYNRFFVPFFNLIPEAMVRRFGAHLIAKAEKEK
jgi:ubiquinone/menaquinone biosynthesis C-methylase UbiE